MDKKFLCPYPYPTGRNITDGFILVVSTFEMSFSTFCLYNLQFIRWIEIEILLVIDSFPKVEAVCTACSKAEATCSKAKVARLKVETDCSKTEVDCSKVEIG